VTVHFNNVPPDGSSDDFSVYSDVEDETAEKDPHAAMSATSPNGLLFTTKILIEKRASSNDVSSTTFSKFIFVLYFRSVGLFHCSLTR
jgi:hypothetical protein